MMLKWLVQPSVCCFSFMLGLQPWFYTLSLFVCLSVCLSVNNFAKKTYERICMKFTGKVGNGLTNKWLNFGGDPDHWSGWIQIVTLIRHALVEVCIVPVLLVGSQPSDHYFRTVCWFVCLCVCAEFFSAVFDPISIKLRHMLYVWV